MSEPSAQGHERRPVRRALVSVYEKAGLPELAQGLHKLGVEIVSTGSTAQRIADTGVPVTAVEELTGFPECLDGRVKTLHPNVHAGLLADTRRPEHVAQLDELGIAPFDLLVANLYPFTGTVASGATPDECVEQIDIGGPAMVRASAKNHDSVAVVVDPERYGWLLEQIEAGGFTLDDRRRLAAAAFRHTATYDVAVASWLGSVLAPDGDGPFPAWVGRHLGAGVHPALRREPAPGRRALHRGPGWPGRRGAVARQGDVVQQLRRRRRRMARRARPWRRAYGRGDQAHQPVRDRGRRGRRRGAPQGARDGPGERVRRRDRDQRRGQRGDGRAGRRGLHRGRAGAVVRARGPGDPHAQEERAAAAPARRGCARWGRDAADLRWPAPAAARPGRRPRRRSRLLDAGHRRPRAGRRAGRPRLRLAGLPRGEVQRDPAGLGRGGRRASGWGR